MPPKRQKLLNGKAFKAKGKEGTTVKNIVMGKPKYITIGELRKPANVTDKLRRDYMDFKSYDRDSMRTNVRNILNQKEVRHAVAKFWGTLDGTEDSVGDSSDDEKIVSENNENDDNDGDGKEGIVK